MVIHSAVDMIVEIPLFIGVLAPSQVVAWEFLNHQQYEYVERIIVGVLPNIYSFESFGGYSLGLKSTELVSQAVDGRNPANHLIGSLSHL